MSTAHLERVIRRRVKGLTLELGPIQLILIATIASLIVYLGSLYTQGIQAGFPLDDSWIHQTFARNLAVRHEFAYNPGELSSGSTSPLWTLILVPGFVLRVDSRLWAYLLGTVALATTGLLGRRLSLRLFPHASNLAVLVGLAVVLEWHLSWAAFSGMETTLFIAATLGLLVYWDRPAPFVGFLGGIATLLRPEGVVAFSLVVTARILSRCLALRSSEADASSIRTKLKSLFLDGLTTLLSFSVVLAPYLAFNMVVAGQPLPTTFYAKHSAYGQGLSMALITGYVTQVCSWLILGPILVLTPGLAFSLWSVAARGSVALHQYRRGNFSYPEVDRLITGTMLVAWCTALVFLYLIRLPVIYHHGRYLFPLLPVPILFGLWGTIRLGAILPYRALVKVFVLAAGLYYVVLWVDGGVNKFAWDVKFINEEQVATATWLRENTAATDEIATHDIGAIGFFSGRRVVDTAGLIVPTLGDRVRDQDAILEFVRESGAAYFALFPKWYPKIATNPCFDTVFRIDLDYAAAQGDNMVVLKWR